MPSWEAQYQTTAPEGMEAWLPLAEYPNPEPRLGVQTTASASSSCSRLCEWNGTELNDNSFIFHTISFCFFFLFKSPLCVWAALCASLSGNNDLLRSSKKTRQRTFQVKDYAEHRLRMASKSMDWSHTHTHKSSCCSSWEGTLVLAITIKYPRRAYKPASEATFWSA